MGGASDITVRALLIAVGLGDWVDEVSNLASMRVPSEPTIAGLRAWARGRRQPVLRGLVEAQDP